AQRVVRADAGEGAVTAREDARPVTPEERAELRRRVIAGETDCPLSLHEAATLMGVSPSWLRRSDVPRAPVAGVKYLKPQCLLYVANRLSHTLIPKERIA